MTARRRGRRAGRVWLREGGRRGEPRSPLAEGVLTTPTSWCSRDDTGYANLCRLVTDAHMTGSAATPRSRPSRSARTRAGSSRCSARPRCPGRLAIAAGSTPRARRSIRSRRRSGDVLRRRRAPGRGRLWRRDPRHAPPGRRAELRRSATNPVRYLVPQDAFLADALECMRRIVPIPRRTSARERRGLAEARARDAGAVRRAPRPRDATSEIAELCTFDLGLRTVQFPEFPTPKGGSASSRAGRAVPARPSARDAGHARGPRRLRMSSR